MPEPTMTKAREKDSSRSQQESPIKGNRSIGREGTKSKCSVYSAGLR